MVAESPRQFVIALDLQLPVDETEVVAHLPADRWEVRFFKLSEQLGAGVLEAARERREIDFDLVSHAMDDVVRKARHEAEDSRRRVDWFVCGRAPLPIFAQTGYELSAWAHPVTLLNQRKGGEWDEIRVAVPSAAETVPPYFDVIEGIDERSEASGRVAVFVSVMGSAAVKETLRKYVEERGDGFAGTVEIRTSAASILDGQSSGRAARELASHMSGLAAAFPYAMSRGIAVFIAGPAHLAFLAGRAINRNIVAETWFPNFSGGVYVDAVALPLREAPSAALDASPEAHAARSRTRNVIRDAFEALRLGLTVGHLPEGLLPTERRLRFIEGLGGIRWTEDVPEDGFALRVLNRELAVGHDLVDALRALPEGDVRGVTCQLVVHELFHNFQALTRANYRQIGRAGVVLEEIDFWADVFAVQALAAWQTGNGVSGVLAVQNEIDHVLAGIEAFDRAQQEGSLRRLYERRLRRYLIWYLQRARAATLQDARDVNRMFAQRMVVELVPTSGYLDDRGDKVVRCATDRTQLVVLCDGQLARFPVDEDLDPTALAEDVRHFRRGPLLQAMETVVGKSAGLLAPWANL